jgi:carboxyl-terminal processing protease
MIKIEKTYIPLFIILFLTFGIVIGKFWGADPFNDPSTPYKSKLNKLINFIESDYVDEVKTDSIVDLTLSNILASLDPHSIYLPAEDQELVAEEMKGDFVGIGVYFYGYQDSIAVVKSIENGPAKKAGIVEGDRILYANTTKLFGKKIDTELVFSKLKGEIDSEVNLTIYRRSNKKTFKVKVKRASIPLKSVDIGTLLNSKTGYIKINRFAENTAKEFHDELVQLKLKGITSLVIDLRENGGGLMDVCNEIADEVLADQELIVFTKNKKGTIEKSFATDKGDFEKGNLAVLIDENSASASEILAGAIQDNDRGLIYGRRSFGKGLVQQEMNFDDGSAVRLTTARYYTPSGRSIQKPYVKGDSEAYYDESYQRWDSGELYQKDKIKIADSLKFKTKKGRIVYGGGGIIPDVFVPMEAFQGEENLEAILQSGVLSHFVFEQLDANRNTYKKMSFEDFKTKFKTQIFLPAFEKYLMKLEFETTVLKSKSVVNRYVRAEFARQLFSESYYYKLLLDGDPMIQEVLKKHAK